MRFLLICIGLLGVGCRPKLVRPVPQDPTPAPAVSSAELAELIDIDALWDHTDPSATRGALERRRVQLEARLAVGDLSADGARLLERARLELLTQLARTHTLEGSVDPADVLLVRVRDGVAADGGADLLRVRVRLELELGRCRRTAREPEAARAHFVEAWELARSGGVELDGLAVDAAHMVAIVDVGTDSELEWGLRALELAEASTSADARKWRATLLNNLGWSYFDRGELDRALELMERQLGLREAAGAEPALRIARWSVARVLRAQGQVEAALAEQESLLQDYGAEALADGYVHEEVAECLLALGRAEDAAPWFAAAHERLSPTWLSEAEPARLARMAELGGVEAP